CTIVVGDISSDDMVGVHGRLVTPGLPGIPPEYQKIVVETDVCRFSVSRSSLGFELDIAGAARVKLSFLAALYGVIGRLIAGPVDMILRSEGSEVRSRTKCVHVEEDIKAEINRVKQLIGAIHVI